MIIIIINSTILSETSLNAMYGVTGQTMTVKCDYSTYATVTTAEITSISLFGGGSTVSSFDKTGNPATTTLAVAAGTHYDTDHWTCVGVYVIGGNTYTVTSDTASLTALSKY